MPANSRNQSLDLVKIIAMIMVVRMHISLNHNLEHFAPFGFIYGVICPAVPLFFMVSGYLMQGKMPDYKYVWRKILGILKYVYIIIPITCVLTGILEHHPRPHSLYLWIIGEGNLGQFWYFASIIMVFIVAPYVCKWVASEKAHTLLAVLLLLCTIVTIGNVYWQFEEHYVRQTFRLYYWIFFFALGAYVKQYGHNEHINWIWVLILMGSAVVFIRPSLSRLFDNLYGCFVCVAYAYCIFCACLNAKIKESKVISELSTLFLPVYTFHPFVIKFAANHIHIDNPPMFVGSIYFVIVFGKTIAISYALMKIPYVNRMFRI